MRLQKGPDCCRRCLTAPSSGIWGPLFPTAAFNTKGPRPPRPGSQPPDFTSVSHIEVERRISTMTISARILQKIVRNEAMASDPPEIYGWRVYLLACSVSYHLITSIHARLLRTASVTDLGLFRA